MYGILDRYVGKNIIMAVLLVAVCMTLFAGLITFIDALRYIGRGSIDFLFVVKYVMHKIPGICVTFFPVSILIGGVVGLGLMARNSEIIILQSIGLSKLNIGVSCVKSIIPLIIVILCIGEFVTPRLEKIAEENFDKASMNVGVSLITNGTWIKEGNNYIGILGIVNGNMLMGVVRYEVDDNKLKSYSHARIGKYENDQWVMYDVNKVTLTDAGTVHENIAKQVWQIGINLKRIEVLSEVSENLSVFQLYDYINYIEHNGVDSSRYRLALYNKFMSPMVMLVMLLLALSTIFGPLRSMNMGARILSGISLGFGYYVLNQIVAPFSIVYGVPPIVGASFATVIFAGFAVYLLNRKS